jgi:hypothetical protein
MAFNFQGGSYTGSGSASSVGDDLVISLTSSGELTLNRNLSGVRLLIVGGGGRSGYDGGAGGGEVVEGNNIMIAAGVHDIIVGRGGYSEMGSSPSQIWPYQIMNGEDSSAFGAIAYGGAAHAEDAGGEANQAAAGQSGAGSGAGGSTWQDKGKTGWEGTAVRSRPQALPAGYNSYRNRGGMSEGRVNAEGYSDDDDYNGGGGGGAGGVGGNASMGAHLGGRGGDGRSNNITGTAVYYGAGCPGDGKSSPGNGGWGAGGGNRDNSGNAGSRHGATSTTRASSGIVILRFLNVLPVTIVGDPTDAVTVIQNEPAVPGENQYTAWNITQGYVMNNLLVDNKVINVYAVGQSLAKGDMVLASAGNKTHVYAATQDFITADFQNDINSGLLKECGWLDKWGFCYLSFLEIDAAHEIVVEAVPAVALTWSYDPSKGTITGDGANYPISRLADERWTVQGGAIFDRGSGYSEGDIIAFNNCSQGLSVIRVDSVDGAGGVTGYTQLVIGKNDVDPGMQLLYPIVMLKTGEIAGLGLVLEAVSQEFPGGYYDTNSTFLACEKPGWIICPNLGRRINSVTACGSEIQEARGLKTCFSTVTFEPAGLTNDCQMAVDFSDFPRVFLQIVGKGSVQAKGCPV